MTLNEDIDLSTRRIDDTAKTYEKQNEKIENQISTFIFWT